MKILVVDDELDICEILQYNLETEGYEVAAVNHLGRTEIQQALRDGNGFDLKRTSQSTHETYFCSDYDRGNGAHPHTQGERRTADGLFPSRR